MNLQAIPKMMPMIPALVRGLQVSDIDTIKELTSAAYPDVRQMSAEQLAARMEFAEVSLLVDVRSAEEYRVSHLLGAINLRNTREIVDACKAHEEAEVILYCAVGFRSSRLAHVLNKCGVDRVYNLEGSIFQWANESRPIYRGTTTVKTVHPFGAMWAGLLKPGLALKE